MKKADDDIANINHRLKTVHDAGEHMKKVKEDELAKLVILRAKLDEKEKQVVHAKTHYEQVKIDLDEKLKKRAALQEEVDRQMSGLNRVVAEARVVTLKSKFWVKEHTSNNVTRDLEVERGYS